MTKWVGRRMPRREDAELLTGRGRYVGDLHRPGMLHAAFLRSPFAHAAIGSIDAEAARAVPGVHAVLTGADLPEDLGAQPNTHLFGERETPYYALARQRVRYAGEPVAVVVAESPYVAEDARDEILVDWEPLPSVGDAELALEEGAPLVWGDRDWPDNVCATFEKEMGDVDRAFAEADVVVTERYRIQRQFACSLEGRGVLAEWDRNVDELTIWTSSQIVHITRDLLSAVLGLPEHRIRVLVPRIGGGFGAKFHFYNEETAVALAARATGRPVRWVEDRMESFVATVHARQQHVELSMAAREDGTITGVKGDLIGDMGAAMHTVGYGPLWLTSVMLTSVYEIANARVLELGGRARLRTLGCGRALWSPTRPRLARTGAGASRRRTSWSSARSTGWRRSSASTVPTCAGATSSRPSACRERAFTTRWTAATTAPASTGRWSWLPNGAGLSARPSCANRAGTWASASPSTPRTRPSGRRE